MHVTERVDLRRLRPPSSVLPSPCAHVSAARRPPPGCHEHSVGSRRSRKKFSSLSCFVLLTTCLYFNSKAFSCSAGESPAEAAIALPSPPVPDPRAEEEFRVWKALTYLLHRVGNETRLAYGKAKHGGEALVKGAAEKTRSARELAKVVGDRAYLKLRDSSAALAVAAQEAARRAREAARRAREAAIQAGESVRKAPGRIWSSAGRGIQRLGGWMTGPESGGLETSDVDSA